MRYRNIFGKPIKKKTFLRMITYQFITLSVIGFFIYIIPKYIDRLDYRQLAEQYIIMEKHEILGTWKLHSAISYYLPFTDTQSYLIFYDDDTYEFHNPTGYSKMWFQNTVELAQEGKCHEVIVGYYRYKKIRQYDPHTNTSKDYNIAKIDFDSPFSFNTVGNKTLQLLVGYLVDHDRDKLVFIKVSEESCCPYCQNTVKINRQRELIYKRQSADFEMR
jgi:hypothetical protein